MEDLNRLRERVYQHFEEKRESSPLEADEPGGVDSGEFCSFLFASLLWRV